MRILVTGGNGFIGRVVVRRLVERGDRVVAVLRDPERSDALVDMGVELRPGDLGKTNQIVDAMRGSDAAIHLAGSYRVGIPASERPGMRDANLGAALRVLDAASSTQMGKIVHVSTVNVFGNTPGGSSMSATGAIWPRVPQLLRRDQVPLTGRSRTDRPRPRSSSRAGHGHG
jgi:dihydroflavonol-4-reductase